MSDRIEPYDPDCKCSHCRRVAEAAHDHYMRAVEPLKERNRQLSEQIMPSKEPDKFKVGR
jgi:hypothetical protein